MKEQPQLEKHKTLNKVGQFEFYQYIINGPDYQKHPFHPPIILRDVKITPQKEVLL